MFFLKKLFASGADKPFDKTDAPAVTEIDLGTDFIVMYENFIVSTQHKLYVVIENRGGNIGCLTFDFLQFQYCYPNDEAPHRYGVTGYGLFEVHHSPLIFSLERQNRSHPRHNSSRCLNYRHFVVRFKDVTLDVVGKGYTRELLAVAEFDALLKRGFEFVRRED